MGARNDKILMVAAVVWEWVAWGEIREINWYQKCKSLETLVAHPDFDPSVMSYHRPEASKWHDHTYLFKRSLSLLYRNWTVKEAEWKQGDGLGGKKGYVDGLEKVTTLGLARSGIKLRHSLNLKDKKICSRIWGWLLGKARIQEYHLGFWPEQQGKLWCHLQRWRIREKWLNDDGLRNPEFILAVKN